MNHSNSFGGSAFSSQKIRDLVGENSIDDALRELGKCKSLPPYKNQQLHIAEVALLTGQHTTHSHKGRIGVLSFENDGVGSSTIMMSILKLAGEIDKFKNILPTAEDLIGGTYMPNIAHTIEGENAGGNVKLDAVTMAWQEAIERNRQLIAENEQLKLNVQHRNTRIEAQNEIIQKREATIAQLIAAGDPRAGWEQAARLEKELNTLKGEHRDTTMAYQELKQQLENLQRENKMLRSAQQNPVNVLGVSSHSSGTVSSSNRVRNVNEEIVQQTLSSISQYMSDFVATDLDAFINQIYDTKHPLFERDADSLKLFFEKGLQSEMQRRTLTMPQLKDLSMVVGKINELIQADDFAYQYQLSTEATELLFMTYIPRIKRTKKNIVDRQNVSYNEQSLEADTIQLTKVFANNKVVALYLNLCLIKYKLQEKFKNHTTETSYADCIA